MTTKYQKVFEYAGAYESEDYAYASGHAWDRLASIAGEYQRGEITWKRAKELCDENLADIRQIAIEEQGSADVAAACEAYNNDYDMQYAHYEQFGRPAFPNEY